MNLIGQFFVVGSQGDACFLHRKFGGGGGGGGGRGQKQ